MLPTFLGRLSNGLSSDLSRRVLGIGSLLGCRCLGLLGDSRLDSFGSGLLIRDRTRG
jgi:hypothetical protein